MKTIGETLKSVREKQDLSLEDIVEKTHIKKEYVRALEEGEFSLLPSPLIIQGFISTYAQILGIEPKTALALLRRDYAVTRSHVVPKHVVASVKRRQPVGTTKWYGLILVAMCAGVVLLYGVMSYTSLHQPPPLTVTVPKDGATIGEQVIVRGRTASDATLEVDTQSVALTQDGEFSQELMLSSGDHTITVIARNRRKQETIKQILVHVQN